MSADNFALIEDLLAPETRTLDLGEYAKAKAGQLLTVHVNANGVEEAISRNVEHQTFDASGKVIETFYSPETSAQKFARFRKVVSILFNLTPEGAARLNDDLLQWLFMQGMELYHAYHKERRDFLPENSTPTITT